MRKSVSLALSGWFFGASLIVSLVSYGAAEITPALSQKADTYLLIEALDLADKEKLNETTPAKIYKAVIKGTATERPKPGTTKETIAGDDGRQTDLWVQVPDGRFKKYGLIIMLHGYGRNGRELLIYGEPLTSTNYTVGYGKFAARNGYIVVGPNALKPLADKSNPDLPPQILGQPTQHWWTYRSDGFVMAIINKLQARYPIDLNRVVLSGMSMGGWGSWNLGMRFPDRFSAIIPFAGGLSMGDYATDNIQSDYYPLIDNLKWLPSYSVHGDQDNIVPARFSQLLEEELLSRKYDHTYDEIEGATHFLSFDQNGPMMQRATKWLKPRKRILHPPEVIHTIIDEDHGRQHWLRIDERIDKTKAAKIHGTIAKKNTINIESENVASFTIFIDNQRLREKSSITVNHNGDQVHKGKVAESTDALIESWKDRRDPHLLHTRMIIIGADEEEKPKDDPAKESRHGR
jgi:poly(3-hydroxybutyrate) depolymerase